MEQYCILGRIGEGAHGNFFKAKHVETGEIVALKKVALRRLEDGIPNQALREIKALQEIEDSQYDLKPANLLISASRQLKIADFGLAWGLFPRWLPPLHAPGGHQEMTTTRSPSRSRCPCPWRRCCWMPLPRLWSFWGGSSSTLHSSALQPPRTAATSYRSSLCHSHSNAGPLTH
uniref:Cyclin-dependent kinase 20 n=1 Tax=Sus scrofa TaxID=9823 RepID=A0A4X1SYB8_PIG